MPLAVPGALHTILEEGLLAPPLATPSRQYPAACWQHAAALLTVALVAALPTVMTSYGFGEATVYFAVLGLLYQ